jgi:predicted RNA methylase
VVGTADPIKPFTAYDIQTCLHDGQRVRYLHEAIERTVRPGDVVVDAGSGTGLLGLLAARAGAARVYCLELNPDFKAVIEANAANNGLADRIVVETVDATAYVPSEPVDVVISEVISGGFFYEPQLQIVNNLRPHLRPGGRMVPHSMRNYVELIDAQEELYGLRFTFDSRFTDLEHDRSLTERACYQTATFATGAGTDPEITGQVTVRATGSGTVNAVKITYDVEFAEGLWAGGAGGNSTWPALLNPQIIFRDRVDLVEGERYEVRLAYEASSYPITCVSTVRQPGPVAPQRASRSASQATAGG